MAATAVDKTTVLKTLFMSISFFFRPAFRRCAPVSGETTTNPWLNEG